MKIALTRPESYINGETVPTHVVQFHPYVKKSSLSLCPAKQQGWREGERNFYCLTMQPYMIQNCLNSFINTERKKKPFSEDCDYEYSLLQTIISKPR